MPKNNYLIQKRVNTVEESSFRCIVYLFSWISIELSIKWALVEAYRTKLSFLFNIGLKTSISAVYMPKNNHLMQKMVNTIEVSSFRCIVYLFSWISIKLSIKWALAKAFRTKLSFSYNIGLKTSISAVYCTFMTINQKVFGLESSFWYQIKGIFQFKLFIQLHSY